MNLSQVVLLPSVEASTEGLDRELILGNLESPNDSLVLSQLDKLVAWSSHDGLASQLRSLRLTPTLIKLLSHSNEQIVDQAAAATSYMSGRSSAGPFCRSWTFKSFYTPPTGVETLTAIHIFEPAYSSGAGLGWKTWNAAVVLVEYLGLHVDSFVGKDVLELGCGTGLSGIFCAKFGARSVLMTDYNETVLETVAANGTRNDLPNLAFKRLDWLDLLRQKDASETSLIDWPTFDAIIGSDIVYDPEHADIVPKVLDILLAHNDHARAYIAVGPRPESARFRNIMTSDHNFEEVVHQEPIFVDVEGNSFHHDMLVYKRKNPPIVENVP